MKRFLAGLGALVVLGALIVGAPVLLVALAGNPLPSPEQWQALVTFTPDYGNVILFTKIIPMLCWVVWALFAVPFLVELVAAVRGRPTRKRITAFRLQQKLAAGLIGAVAVMFAGGGAAIAAPAPAFADTVAASSVASSAPVAAEVPAAPVMSIQQAPPEMQSVSHTIVAGDTLWGLAQHYYGDGGRFMEIFNASQGVQPDGHVMTDPDVILEGWVMTIPGVAAAGPEAPAPAASSSQSVETPAPDAPDVDSSTHGVGGAPSGAHGQGGPRGAQDQGTPDEASTGATADLAADSDDGLDLSVPAMTAAGIGGILAAGLLSALSRRRLRQRNRRAKGERITLPEPEVEELEQELRRVEDPIAVSDVDNALRTLQAWAEDTGEALPELLAVRIADEEVALYLAAPAQLPDPFESMHEDGTAWIVRPGRARAPERATVSPYPALATIGTDPQGGFLLLDLEQIGSLNVVGDEETARGVLNALACEFAGNPWSDQIQVTLVGLDDALARDVDRFRIEQVADVPALVRNLRADLEDRRAALDSYGVGGVLEARSRATETEEWAPHVVILGEPPEEHLRAELAELVARMPRLGIATIAQGDAVVAGATIQVMSKDAAEYRSGGTLPPIPFRPQVLCGEKLQLVRELFETTNREAQPADLVQEHPRVDAVTPDHDVKSIDAGQNQPTESDETLPAAADGISTEQRSRAETADDARRTAVFQDADAPADAAVQPLTAVTDDAPATHVDVPDWPAPYIRLLGPVDALNITDLDAMPGHGIEFLAFLLLQNTSSVPGALVQKKLWPDTYSTDNNNARQLAKAVRRVLGHDPFGQLLLPEGRSNAGFTLHPALRTDWHDFCDLIGPDLATTPNDNLIRAIRLVRGQPFDGVSRRKGWWSWRGVLEETMRAAVLDAADELTHRALRTGRLDDARLGARIAQAADPLNEAGWRLEIETAMSAGDVETFNAIVDAMFDVIGADVDLDEATQKLLDDAHETLPGAAR